MKESTKLGNGVRAVGPSQRAASGRYEPLNQVDRSTVDLKTAGAESSTTAL